MCVLAQDLGYAHSTPRSVTLPKDVVRQEANRVYSEWLWAWRQRRRSWSTARARIQAWKECLSRAVLIEVDEDREEGEVTPPPHSPLPEDLAALGDLFNW
jgi:hypothetical protein